MNREEYYQEYRYPTLEEKQQIYNDHPIIKRLRFEGSFNLSELYNGDLDNLISISLSLEPWERVLDNRLIKLQFAYTLTIFHLNRGIPDDNWKSKDENDTIIYFPDFNSNTHNYRKFLFDFFIDNSYSLIFSINDTLYNMSNVLFNLDIPNSSYFNSQVISKLKLKNEKLVEMLQEFKTQTGDANKNRNDNTHNIPVYELNERVKSVSENLTIFSTNYKTSNECFNEITHCLEKLVELINYFKEMRLK